MLTSEELLVVRGGGIAATLINSVSRLISTILDLGQTVGSALRRATTKKYCSIS